MSKHKRRIINITTNVDYTNRNSALAPHFLTQPPTVKSRISTILKKTFKNNHLEDLKLNSLNYSQKNYLRKFIKEQK